MELWPRLQTVIIPTITCIFCYNHESRRDPDEIFNEYTFATTYA